MAPLGADLTVDDLLTALKWKLETEYDARQIENFTDLQRTNWFSEWTRRAEDSNHVISLIGRRLNVLPVVNRLPVEIMEEILLVWKHDSEIPNTSFQLPPSKSNLNGANLWVKITHVCHHWRSTAHKTRALWRRISIGKGLQCPASLASFFFKLSHPLPIRLEQDLGPLSKIEEERMNQFYSSLLDQPHRISALYLRGHLPDMARRLFQVSLPNIVEVDVFFERVKFDDAQTKKFLGGNSSILQKLSLENHPWPRATFPVLTHLYLKDVCTSPVNEDEFFDLLRSVSSTLQVLYLEDSTPIVEDPDNYKLISPATKICMLALRHLEIYAAQYPDEPDYALIHLQNLSLPSVKRIIWNHEMTDEIRCSSPTSRLGMSIVLPAECLARVTSMVGRARRTGCYTLSGPTLYFDPAQVGIDTLEYWQPHLPNVVTLALPPGHANFIPVAVYWGMLKAVLIKYTTVKSLHICSTSHVLLELIMFALEEHYTGPGFLPHFQTLAVYVGGSSIPRIERNTSEELAKNELEKVQLSVENSMVRTRPHLQATYTLQFKMGDLRGLQVMNI